MKSLWLEPDALKGASPVLKGGELGNKFLLTRPVQAIFNSTRKKPKYMLDADISKCFDCIDQEALLRKLNTFSTICRQVCAWLKAGVMDGKQLFPTSVSEAGARTRATYATRRSHFSVIGKHCPPRDGRTNQEVKSTH
ncbi:MAG: hypothetical protein V7K48_06770 [Nostoc sp.]|uniref:hypothetical protein n=1 Tax=Nostoc sp. TaxID=1180 RepID=UPI002FFA1F04